MKRLVLLLVLMVLAAAMLGMWVLDDPGYLVILRDNVRIETTLGFALLVLALLLFATAATTLLLAAMWDAVSPFQLKGRWGHYLARRRLIAGFQALTAGKWKQAHRLLGAAAISADWEVPALLGAAYAADQAGDSSALQAALNVAANKKRGELPATVYEAHVLRRDGYVKEALAILKPLLAVHGNNPHLLMLVTQLYQQREDWDALRELLPKLKNHYQGCYHNMAQFNQLEQQVWHGLLKQQAEVVDLERQQKVAALKQLWKAMPGHLNKLPILCAQYAGYLAQFGDGETALSLVRKEVEKSWDDRLIVTLEAISNVAPERLLALLETWLKGHPDNAALLLTAGRVSLRSQLWGKARDFFNAAAAAGSEAALAELARLYSALGEHQKAAQAFDQRAKLLSAELPVLPLP